MTQHGETLGLPTFQTAMLFFPIAVTVHVLEELPGFTLWTRRYINPRFTRQHYVKVHIASIGLAILTGAVLWFLPTRPLVLAFFTLIVTPGLFWNTAFHAGASVAYRSYSPGLITALGLYLPLFATLSGLAIAEGLISSGFWLLSTCLAGCIHMVEVRHNVFRFHE
jgi:hypothetical protein